MEPLRFIHAADLHLDSPFRGLGDVSPGLRETFEDATFSALERIVDCALECHADFVVFAGDLYDSRDRSLRALVEFRRQMERLAERGIAAFVVHGNHDPLNGWGSEFRLPENVLTFDGQIDSRPVLRKGREVARVTGVSYTEERVTENLASAFRRNPDTPYAIAVLHANIGGQSGHADYAPASMEDLIRAGFDYWALGHVHTRSVLSTSPAVVYPGNPQGRNARESGPRGCYRVDVDCYGHHHLQFIETNVMRWRALELPIRDHGCMDELLEALLEEGRHVASEFEGPTVVRCTLTGNGPLHRDLQREGIEDELREQLQSAVAVESVRIATGPEIDVEALAGSGTVVGDFLSLVQRAKDDPVFRQSLAQSLEPLFRRKELSLPGDARLSEWIEKAGSLGVDLLVGP